MTISPFAMLGVLRDHLYNTEYECWYEKWYREEKLGHWEKRKAKEETFLGQKVTNLAYKMNQDMIRMLVGGEYEPVEEGFVMVWVVDEVKRYWEPTPKERSLAKSKLRKFKKRQEAKEKSA